MIGAHPARCRPLFGAARGSSGTDFGPERAARRRRKSRLPRCGRLDQLNFLESDASLSTGYLIFLEVQLIMDLGT
jgi:hypothetical protein